MQEKGQLLKRWVCSGENIQSCESSIRVSKKRGLEGRRKKCLIAVKDMGSPPWEFQPVALTMRLCMSKL